LYGEKVASPMFIAKGHGLLLITPSYISAIYIPWIRRSFRVKALTGPAKARRSHANCVYP
jgi:hypothetical protein